MRLKAGEIAPPLRLCLLRCLAVTIEGLLLTGPGLHYLYSALEAMVPSQVIAQDGPLLILMSAPELYNDQDD